MNNVSDLKKSKQLATDLFLLDGNIEDVPIDDLVLMLKTADDLYFNDQESFLSDEQYDSIRRIASQIDSTNTYFVGIGSEVRGGKIKLPFFMGSLTQSYEGDIEKWVNKYRLHNEKIAISDKMDGVSALVLFDAGELQIAYSRGDGIEGADITRHIRKMKSVPKKIKTNRIKAVRCELIISEPNFKKIGELGLKSRGGEPYKNARNAIAGLMNAENNPSWVYDYIDCITYEVVSPNFLSKDEQFEELNMSGFQIAPVSFFDGGRLTDKMLIEMIYNRREESIYAIDGIVLEINDADLRKRINPTKETLNPEYARKFKIASEDNVAVVTVVDVHWNVSKAGYLKPRVEIEPVELVGVTITYATGFNAKFIYENKVGPGAKIRITRSGDVIPFIQEVVEPSNVPSYSAWFKFKLGTIGEWQWTDTMVDAYLVNDHPDIALERAKDFFATIDAPILREGNIIKLFDAGYNTPTKIIQMTKKEMISVLGENGKKAFDGLYIKLNPIPLYVLMAASGTFGRGMGVRKLKKLYFAAKGDLVKFTDINFICGVEGFEEKTARRIIDGKEQWNAFFTNVMENVTLEVYEEKETIEGELSGQVFVFTGFRDKVLQQKIEDAGGVVVDSYSKKVTYVVAKDPSENSSKLQKAHKDGIKVVSVNEAWEMVE